MFRELDDIADSTWALAVLAASAECGLLASISAPATAEEASEQAGMSVDLARRMLDVLVALDFAHRPGDEYVAAEAVRPMLTPDGLLQLRADLRTTFLQSRDLVDRAERHTLAPGWVHTDPHVLHAQGDSGRAAAHALAEQGILRLAGLADRLSAPTASFLDVGTGVGVIAIEMCHAYPQLRVVGLEPAQAPRREAIERVADAGLSDRIDIRAQALEALTDVECFDLAYVPQVFLPDEAFPSGIPLVWRALRPGGWVTLPVISAPGNDLGAALARLRNTLWGGGARFADEVAEAITRAGFIDVQVRHVGRTRSAIAGRRP